MKDFLQWILKMVCFLCFFQVFLQLVPKESYRKFLKFFGSLLLILMVARPIAVLINQDGEWERILKEEKGGQVGEKKEQGGECQCKKSGKMKQFYRSADESGGQGSQKRRAKRSPAKDGGEGVLENVGLNQQNRGFGGQCAYGCSCAGEAGDQEQVQNQVDEGACCYRVQN